MLVAKARRKKRAEAAVTEVKEPLVQRLERFAEHHPTWLVLALILLGTIRIAATYTVSYHTADEPAHIACGMQWLSLGVYRYEPQHPPLTRIVAALGPYFVGARSTGQGDMHAEGVAILHAGNEYEWRLALSRSGNLLFFWLACWMVFLWGRRTLGTAGAVAAVLIFTMVPTVLAHAGFATTDMGITACFAATAYASLRLIEQPGAKTAGWLGLTGGLMVLTKFSALLFYPAAVAAALAVWIFRNRPSLRNLLQSLSARLPWLGVAALAGFIVIWAGYRFSFGKTVGIPFPVPFPELYPGIQEVIHHNSRGHIAFFLGAVSENGWWLFFPTLLAVKLPIAALALIAVGLWRRSAAPCGRWPFWIVIAIATAILVVVLPARINIGLRHILPMFPFLALMAAAGLLWLARQERRSPLARWTLAGLTLWLCAGSLAAHPDYLAYFNAFAGSEPERIVVDSDLDWGQDIKRLGQRLRELHATSVGFSPAIMLDPSLHGFPPWQWSAVDAPFPGWNAVEVTVWKAQRMGFRLQQPDVRLWPDFTKPVERVGKSILLYYVPPQL
jgi:4-amino-4-deoxy-L-arabinose transferase-like glycosyltransferase